MEIFSIFGDIADASFRFSQVLSSLAIWIRRDWMFFHDCMWSGLSEMSQNVP